MIISSSIHAAANAIILFFFMVEEYSIVFMHHMLSTACLISTISPLIDASSHLDGLELIL